MSKDLDELVKEHQAFYEVTPYHLVLQENPGKFPPKNRTIQAGFDVDIYGLNNNKEPLLPGPDYALGYVDVQRFAEEISAAQVIHSRKGCCDSEFRIVRASTNRLAHSRNRSLRKSNTNFGRLVSRGVEESTRKS